MYRRNAAPRRTVPTTDHEEARVAEACQIIARWQGRHAPGMPTDGLPALPVPLADGPLPGGFLAWQGQFFGFGRALRQFRLFAALWGRGAVEATDLIEVIYGEDEDVSDGRLRTLAWDLTERLTIRWCLPLEARWIAPACYHLRRVR